MKLTTIAMLAAAMMAGPAFAQGKSAEHKPDHAGGSSVVALAGGANAAHASPVAFANANPASMVGKVKVYAHLQQALDSGDLQQTLVDAQTVFYGLYPNFDDLTEEEQVVALATPEGQALIAAEMALEEAAADRDEALAALGPNALTPEVKAYIDSLLND